MTVGVATSEFSLANGKCTCRLLFRRITTLKITLSSPPHLDPPSHPFAPLTAFATRPHRLTLSFTTISVGPTKASYCHHTFRCQIHPRRSILIHTVHQPLISTRDPAISTTQLRDCTDTLTQRSRGPPLATLHLPLSTQTPLSCPARGRPALLIPFKQRLQATSPNSALPSAHSPQAWFARSC